MGKKGFIGEFEQVVLLAILQLKDQAYATDISRKLESDAGRPSREPGDESSANRSRRIPLQQEGQARSQEAHGGLSDQREEDQ